MCGVAKPDTISVLFLLISRTPVSCSDVYKLSILSPLVDPHLRSSDFARGNTLA